VVVVDDVVVELDGAVDDDDVVAVELPPPHATSMAAAAAGTMSGIGLIGLPLCALSPVHPAATGAYRRLGRGPTTQP